MKSLGLIGVELLKRVQHDALSLNVTIGSEISYRGEIDLE